jgi:hypothetical protein
MKCLVPDKSIKLEMQDISIQKHIDKSKQERGIQVLQQIVPDDPKG